MKVRLKLPSEPEEPVSVITRLLVLLVSVIVYGLLATGAPLLMRRSKPLSTTLSPALRWSRLLFTVALYTASTRTIGVAEMTILLPSPRPSLTALVLSRAAIR